MELAADDTSVKGAFLKGIRRLSGIPFFFLGIGIYRAWIEFIFMAPVVPSPVFDVTGNNLYDLFLIITLLIMAASSRRWAPYLPRRVPYIACFVLMTASTVLTVVSYYIPSIVVHVALPAALMGGVGTAFIILLWSELYGCLNLRKVAICYSGSMILCALIVFLMKGFVTNYFMGVLVCLPGLSVFFVWRSFKAVPDQDRPRVSRGKFSFPVKPVVLTAAYAFAFGLIQTSSKVSNAMHSSLATVTAAAIILCIVLWSQKEIGFAVVYRVAFPLMVFGLLLVSAAFPNAGSVSAFCVTMSYTASWIFMMMICANLCHSYGVSAIWLFGIERGLRTAAQMSGRLVHTVLSTHLPDVASCDMAVTIISIMMIIFGMAVLYSEPDFTTRWGIRFLNPEDAEDSLVEMNRLATRCTEVCDEYHLSQREAEVLGLLAQKKTISEVEEELFIAEGTAKAHMRHIYEKLDIHSRQELFEILDVDE